MLTAKLSEHVKASCVFEFLLTEIITSGGSREMEVKELKVIPQGRDLYIVVAMVTPCG
ncbi:MAG: hypothetical protein QXD47_09145 [Candidatus Caldarchaeum sp.]